MPRELTWGGRLASLVLAACALGVAYILLDLLAVMPTTYLAASTAERAGMLLGAYVVTAVLVALVYRSLPSSRV